AGSRAAGPGNGPQDQPPRCRAPPASARSGGECASPSRAPPPSIHRSTVRPRRFRSRSQAITWACGYLFSVPEAVDNLQAFGIVVALRAARLALLLPLARHVLVVQPDQDRAGDEDRRVG